MALMMPTSGVQLWLRHTPIVVRLFVADPRDSLQVFSRAENISEYPSAATPEFPLSSGYATVGVAWASRAGTSRTSYRRTDRTLPVVSGVAEARQGLQDCGCCRQPSCWPIASTVQGRVLL